MLPAAMSRPTRFGAALLALLALLAVGAGCGKKEGLSVEEGEPLELGDLLYNVQLTRFVTSSDREDRSYLTGQPDPPPGKKHLAVFVKIENEGDEEARVPEDFEVIDTRGNKYKPLESKSLFAVPLGARIPADGEIPEPDTPAASGPVSGSMLLFLVDEGVSENRPLDLEVPGPNGETGKVELDI